MTDLPSKLLLQTSSRVLILLYRILTFPHVKNEHCSTHRRPTPPQVISPHCAAWGSEALSCAPWPAWCHAKRSGSKAPCRLTRTLTACPSHSCSLICYSKPKTHCWEKTRTPNTHPGRNPCFVLNPILNFTHSVKNKQARKFNYENLITACLHEENWSGVTGPAAPAPRRAGQGTGGRSAGLQMVLLPQLQRWTPCPGHPNLLTPARQHGPTARAGGELAHTLVPGLFCPPA